VHRSKNRATARFNSEAEGSLQPTAWACSAGELMPLVIAIDATGGDHGPKVTVPAHHAERRELAVNISRPATSSARCAAMVRRM